MKLNRGDIVIANLESVSKGSIQKYTRPYIIISNNKANQYSPVVTAVAMSTKTWKKKYLPYERPGKCHYPSDRYGVCCHRSCSPSDQGSKNARLPASGSTGGVYFKYDLSVWSKYPVPYTEYFPCYQ